MEGNWGPSHAHFFPKSSDQNFEIAILFSMVENMIKMSFRMTWSPKVPRGRAESYELYSMLTYSIGYWEVYRLFQRRFFLVGGGRRASGAIRKDLSMKEVFMGEGTLLWRGRRISQHYLKKDQKLYIKKTGFSTEGGEHHRDLERRRALRIWLGSPHSRYLAL